jgi:outer membrane protein assembly factor BamB
VFFGSQDGVVSALDADSGKVRWTREVGAAVATPLTVRRDDVYLVTRAHRLLRLDRGHGRIRAEVRLASNAFGPVVVAGDGLAVFVNDRRHGDEPALSLHRYPASLTPAEPTWIHELPGGWTSSRPYVVGDTVIGGGQEGHLTALRIADGQPIWTDRVKGIVRGIGIEGRRLFVGTLSGTLYSYEPPR